MLVDPTERNAAVEEASAHEFHDRPLGQESPALRDYPAPLISPQL